MKILFLTPYPLKEAPSQRFRFEQYFNLLNKNGNQYRVQSFLESHNWKVFYKSGNFIAKFLALVAGFSKRFLILFNAYPYDFIFIHREATPIGPPIIEWMISKMLRKKIVYDFDDAIWLTDKKVESWFERTMRQRSKVAKICSLSYKVSCGNNFLCSYATQFNENVILNRTTIDTEGLHNPSLYKKPSQEKMIIGWTGSHSTLKYLVELEGVLQDLEKKYPQLETWVIADRKPDLKIKNLSFKPWSLTTEINDLAQIDIGVMPLPNDEWARGKCGFKALQYMALEIPTIVSPVGVNSEIIEHGVNGFLAIEADQWFEYLDKLIEDKNLRKKVGLCGRETVVKHYSVLSNSSTFLTLFE